MQLEGDTSLNERCSCGGLLSVSFTLGPNLESIQHTQVKVIVVGVTKGYQENDDMGDC